MASVASLQQAVSAAARQLEAAEATHAATPDAQGAAAAALVEAKRGQLAAAQRVLREGEDEALKQLVLAPLFPELASLVFALLPVDSRLRCREVCRGWRAFLADVRFWQVCDLSATSGVARRSPALLRAASERARGTLRELDVSCWYRGPVGEGVETLDDEQLLSVLRSNAASLLALRVWKPVGGVARATAAEIERLLIAAPRLRLLECDAFLQGVEAAGPVPRLLHEPQFAPLRLRILVIYSHVVQPPLDVPALAAWAATHPSLKCFMLDGAQLEIQPALDAVATMTASQLKLLILFDCHLSPASLPALMRMLESRSLKVLAIFNGNMPLFVGASVPAFCTALRASRLTSFDLCSMRLWESQADSLAFIAACTDHPTLRKISFVDNGLQHAPGRAAIEAALDALQASIPRLSLDR